MDKIIFFEKNGRIDFQIPTNPELEADIRMAIKVQHCKPKAAFYFKRGIIDTAQSIQNGKPRKYGTPIVQVKSMFNNENMIIPAKEAKRLLGDNHLDWSQIKQVGGSKLPKDYFHDFDAGKIGQ